MLTLNKLIPGARGLAPVLVKRAATVELNWDVRQKSRFDATDSQGRTLGVFLPRGSVVRGGDMLVAEDGSLVKVAAANQPVLVVTPCPQHGTPFDLVRAAYHLGNRHVALELQPDHLKLEPDHVLADMLRQMHLIVNEAEAAFEPESGAYAAGSHGHDHGTAPTHPQSEAHTQDHAHADGHKHEASPVQPHDHAHAPAPSNSARKPIAIAVKSAAAHVHGPGCNHGHDHDHSKTQGHEPGDHGHSHPDTHKH